MVDADGTQVHRIVDANPGDIFEYGYYADMSPDGTKIVYSTCEFPTEGEVTYSERENYNYEIAVINLDGTGQRRLTENRTFEHYPVWSPDGSRIAYLSGDPALMNWNFTRWQRMGLTHDWSQKRWVQCLLQGVVARRGALGW